MGYGTVDTSEAANAGLFAVPAMFVTFRETLEAAIIVSVLLGLLEKLNLVHLKRYVWLGVLAAFGICVVLGVIVLVVINVVKEEFLSGNSGLLVQGIVSVVAAVLIGVVALTIGNVMAINDKWEARLANQVGDIGEDAISKKSILFLSFTAVLREGLETIIFFVGIGAAYPGVSLPIPAVVGAIVGWIIGWALYRFGGRLTIKWFFRFTMVLLVFIGAGVFTNGMHELQVYGSFGTWEPDEDRPAHNQPVFDISGCCGLDKQFWVLMRVLFGYQPEPTPLDFVWYFGYHAAIWIAVVVRYKRSMAYPGGKPPPLRHVIYRRICLCKGPDPTTENAQSTRETHAGSFGLEGGESGDAAEKAGAPGPLDDVKSAKEDDAESADSSSATPPSSSDVRMHQVQVS